MIDQLTSLTHAIQLAVAPVFMLTAISTMINAMNGRLNRVIDRRRALQHRKQQPCEARVTSLIDQELVQLATRGKLIYQAIFSQVLAALLVCLVVICAFTGTIVSLSLVNTVATLFILSMLAMIVGLGLLLREIFIAVRRPMHWEP